MGEQNEASVRVHPTAEASSLQERLDTAKRRTRAAEAQRDAREEERSLLAQVETEERNAADEEAIAKFEEEHGPKKIAIVRTEYGCVIVKRPNPVLYKRFRDRESAKTVDLEKLVRPCLLYPTAEAFDQMLEDAPATLDRVADRVVYLAGFRSKEVAEK